jgi:hypothetical protein
MNIFFIHKDPQVCAEAMTDKHIVKMIIETAQLLSTAHHILDPEKDHTMYYKVTHMNHPSAVWARETHSNYEWLYRHFIALCDEYTKRYQKVHLTDTKLRDLLKKYPLNIQKGAMTEIKVAMPDQYHRDDKVSAYRQYYTKEKLKTEKDYTRYISVMRGAFAYE